MKTSLIASKLTAKSLAIYPSINDTGKYALGDTSTAYANLIALSPCWREQPGRGCSLHTPWYIRKSPLSFSILCMDISLCGNDGIVKGAGKTNRSNSSPFSLTSKPFSFSVLRSK